MSTLRIPIDATLEVRVVRLGECHGKVYVGAECRILRPIIDSCRKDLILSSPVLPDETTHVAKAMAGGIQPECSLAEMEVDPLGCRHRVRGNRSHCCHV